MNFKFLPLLLISFVVFSQENSMEPLEPIVTDLDRLVESVKKTANTRSAEDNLRLQRFLADKNRQQYLLNQMKSQLKAEEGRSVMLTKEYEDNEKLFFDIAQTYKKAVQEFYDIGCRYLQMDDIFFAYLCDPNHRTTRMKFGEDPDELIEKYAWMLNEAIKDRPKDMTVGMHLCRGNFKSNFAAQGAYDPTVDAVFNKIDLDVYFMEYDDERSGGLEPLKYLPKGNKRVMPGFITTKQGKLETLDFLQKKFEEASKYISIDQLGIAPQCGFSSTEEGNIISLEDQKRKLELVIEASNKIWGE